MEKMKIIGVIPARYASSRLPGKPLLDIGGKPMIWWVYQQAKKVAELDEVYVATDDERIAAVCREHDMPFIMTSDTHQTPADRIHEVSEKVRADLYVEINGDEPLIVPATIRAVIPGNLTKDKPFVASLYSRITNPIDAIDTTNLKVVVGQRGLGLYISRIPIPFPKGSLDFEYKKYIGIVAFNKIALDEYAGLPRGEIESAEDIDLLRFIENGIPVLFLKVECKTISVDTYKDLERVRELVRYPPPPPGTGVAHG
ncbi:MAG: 3-deoxy-manno-octulosonate cytidylyltransferase [Treponema sp.]|jgi:3-deoxy-manno-octulosonate cytidylyltransferase (CMP-KDO synthetase)|nr:3-deoxy-manno-octulosonate cytidylyltransferase [Treponema sp.]